MPGPRILMPLDHECAKNGRFTAGEAFHPYLKHSNKNVSLRVYKTRQSGHSTSGLGCRQWVPNMRSATICRYLGLSAIVIAASLAPRVALADFRVCNATQNLVGVAIGYRAAAGWITEGWWHIEGSTCKTLIEGPLSSRYYYLYAEDAERGGRWDGPITMCVADKEFKIVGTKECIARGFQRAGFQEHDTGEQPSWMVQLADDPSPDNTATITGGDAQ